MSVIQVCRCHLYNLIAVLYVYRYVPCLRTSRVDSRGHGPPPLFGLEAKVRGPRAVLNAASTRNTYTQRQYGFQVLGSEFAVLGSEYEVLGSEYEVLGSEYEVLGLEYEVLGSEYEVLDSEFEA